MCEQKTLGTHGIELTGITTFPTLPAVADREEDG